jgi:hypothetical protein
VASLSRLPVRALLLGAWHVRWPRGAAGLVRRAVWAHGLVLRAQASSAQDAQAQAEELRGSRAAVGAPQQYGQLQAGDGGGRPVGSSAVALQALLQRPDAGRPQQQGPGAYRGGGGGRQQPRAGRGRGSGRSHGGRGI